MIPLPAVKRLQFILVIKMKAQLSDNEFIAHIFLFFGIRIEFCLADLTSLDLWAKSIPWIVNYLEISGGKIRVFEY